VPLAEASDQLGRRERVLTDKGREFSKASKERALTSAVSKWRGTAAKAERAITECENITELKEFRDKLEIDLLSVSEICHQLTSLSTDDDSSALMKRLDSLEEKNLDLLRAITTRIQDVQYEARSRKSHHSSQSCSSRISGRSAGSRSSNHSTASSKRAEAAAEAAALRVKLKHLDAEAKQKAELERIQTTMQLDMANAKVEALQIIEDRSLNADAQEFVPQLAQANKPALVEEQA
jgi:hypothetical protein